VTVGRGPQTERGADAAPGMHGATGAVGAVQRRTMRVLVASQVLGGVGVGSGIAVVGLLAYELSGTESLSGVSATASVLGAAGAAVVIARVTGARGRRPGLVVGYLVGAVGAVLAVVAAIVGSFPLHVVASLAFGWASASNLQARYAATDLAVPARRGRSLSTVVWATTIGAVLGPNLTGPGGVVADAVGLPALAGPYLFSLLSFVAAAMVQVVGLRPDPLLLARQRERAAPAPAMDEVRPETSLRGALAIVGSHRVALTALTAIAAAHATMVAIMVMTPVHLEHHGASLQVVGLTISLHIAGMYALSPLVGRLADRVGRRPTLGLGLLQLVAAASLAAFAAPTGSAWFQTGLVLLGTGWSFCLVAGSTLLVDETPTEARTIVQGASDLVMNLAGAVGGITAGVVLAVAGYEALALGSLLLLVPPAWLLLTTTRTPGASAGSTPPADVVQPAAGPAGLVVDTPTDR
jgi:MFS family permease